MKAIKSFSKIIIAVILAMTLTTLTACDMLDGIFGNKQGDGNVYSVTLNANGGTFTTDLTEYTSGTVTYLPANGTKEHYTFDGWYVSSDCSGKAVPKISATATGDKEYWAKWIPDSYTLTFSIVGDSYQSPMNSYSYGSNVTLPKPEKSGSTFNGWYINSDLSGTVVKTISAGEYGNKTFYGEWVDGETPDNPDTPDVPDVPKPSENEVTVTAFGGYEEGAYIEFDAVSGVSQYQVSYKAEGASSYTNIDSELIRISSSTVRADIVGLKAGDYTIKVTAGTKTSEKDVTVTAYDRSGYAHFGTDVGVGAYNNDGTPKSGAEIIYVNESNKNTVVASYLSGNDDENRGIVAVLRDVYKASNPVIIRVVGRVAAATWNLISYEGVDATVPSNIKGLNNKQLPTSSASLTQEKLIAGGYNTLNTSVYSELNNLSSSASYSSSKKVYDSTWNDCPITGSTSKPPKNVTVEGIGIDGEIFQWGMTWKYAHSVEIRNLIFTDYTEDACSFQGNSAVDDSQRIWVHNCTFERGKNYWDITDEQDKADGDGATDFKWATYITVSYNHYKRNHKTGLIGANSDSLTSNVTFHHNFYDACESRLPLSRQANMHMYNNYYHNANTSISLRAYAYAFIENCYFDGSNNTMIDIQSYDKNTLKSYGVAKIYNCVLNGKGYSYSSSGMPSSERPDSSAMESPFIIKVTDRTTKVANNNQFCQDFDTNSSFFYYDSSAKKSKVTRMDETANVPSVVQALAGVHKN